MTDTESELVKRLRRISTPGDLFSEAASAISRYEAALRDAHEVLHKVVGLVSDQDAAHAEICAAMAMIRAALENKNG